jgi:threonine aldolase
VSPEPIDLRSDVVAQPTDTMRDATRDARLGAYLDTEDPTVAQLERECAALFGKEAGLFLPSATMANLIACMHYCRPAEQAIVDQDAHVYRNEFAGMTRAGGILPRVVPRAGAVPVADAVRNVVARRNAAEYPARLLWIENTHNVGGGAVATPSEIAELRQVVEGHEIAIHVDGARIFNAAVALGLAVDQLANGVDSVSVGFNKGMACPIGCVLVGSAALIEGATALRRMLGGRFTKGGIAAAACLVALETMVDRLADDHQAAQQLGRAIEETPGLRLESPVVTNIVRFDTSEIGPAPQFADRLREHGVLAGAVGETVIRIVTHHHITPEATQRAIDALRHAAMAQAPALAN